MEFYSENLILLSKIYYVLYAWLAEPSLLISISAVVE